MPPYSYRFTHQDVDYGAGISIYGHIGFKNLPLKTPLTIDLRSIYRYFDAQDQGHVEQAHNRIDGLLKIQIFAVTFQHCHQHLPPSLTKQKRTFQLRALLLWKIR